MRQQFFLSFRTPFPALVGLAILTGCAQPASVGIPTPNAALVAARQTITAQSIANAAATQTAAAPAPTPVPTIEPPTPVPTIEPLTPVPPLPTETPLPLPPPPAPADQPSDHRQPGSSGSSGVACGRQIIHVVQPGQNLFRIALRYRTTINAIARLNGITNTRLVRVGQRLRVVTCARGSSSAPYYGAHYVVKPGDTLFRIAVRYGVNVSGLMAANGLRSTLIVPGQNLVIP